jgi:LysR family transcriptional regulator, benzoate and cis,cis-muconate-responsive activator of ben and cat genes
MDLKRLRYFVTVARLRSFTRAAEVLHMAQPPLSQRIQELEMELGVQLLDRDSRPISLTEAGQALYDQAVQVLQKTDAMLATMRRFVSHERPCFTFGIVPANFHGDLAAIIRLYRQALPGTDVKLLELNSYEQVAALRDGRIDAGISRVPIEAEGVHRILLRQEPMVVALPEDHPLAAQEEVMTLDALKDHPFLLYLSPPRPSLADHILGQLQDRGITLSKMVEVNRYDTALLMIAAGCGLSIVPAGAQRVVTPGVTYRPLAEPITSPIVLCHRQGEASHELRALYFVLARFLVDRGHELPLELMEGVTC